ncbi:hypothetical protein H8356DRAFT_1618034 [Neocallimastix lanati (nom. inval.)]|nr:hypothetical protein H8356DRAFT_1618034 [Neocallimastix sp. JGI-2020a]
MNSMKKKFFSFLFLLFFICLFICNMTFNLIKNHLSFLFKSFVYLLVLLFIFI